MSLAEDGSIEEMALEGGEVGRWDCKVSLTVVVETRNMANNPIDSFG